MDDGASRISTDERDRAAERLREDLVEGRLTLEEFSSRLDLVYRAETAADLAAVAADLPAPRPPARPASKWVVAVMGGSDKKGRWRVAERVNDAYLKSNRVAGGTASYDRSLGLMLEYARSRGGTLTEGPPAP